MAVAFNPRKWLEAAVSRDITRPSLGGVYHAPDGRLVATDGGRMHVLSQGGDRSGRIVDKQLRVLDETFPPFGFFDEGRSKACSVNSVMLLAGIEGARAMAKRLGKGTAAVEVSISDGTLTLLGRALLDVGGRARHVASHGFRYSFEAEGALDPITLNVHYLFDAVNGPWREEPVVRLDRSDLFLGVNYERCAAICARMRP